MEREEEGDVGSEWPSFFFLEPFHSHLPFLFLFFIVCSPA